MLQGLASIIEETNATVMAESEEMDEANDGNRLEAGKLVQKEIMKVGQVSALFSRLICTHRGPKKQA